MYAKIFAQIYDGTLCTHGPWEALVTFQQLLVLADQDGVVDMTAGAIARRTTIPLEIIEKGLTALLQPDPESRTPTEDGKRILPLSEDRAWGWRVVNYGHYRQLKREEDRRDYHRQYWQKRKAKTAQGDSTPKPGLNTTQHTQPIAEAEANAVIEARASKSPAMLPTCQTQAIIDAYHAKLPGLPRVRMMGNARQRAISNFWKWVLTSKRSDGALRATSAGAATDWIASYFERAAENDFLMGRTPRTGEHANWKCDLDFLLTEKGRQHVIEKTGGVA